MKLSTTAYEFSNKAVAQKLLHEHLGLIPYGGYAFVNTCGNGSYNGSYFVIVVRGKKGQHVGYLNW